MGKLTDRALRNLKPTGTAYKVADGRGLYVDVGRTGTRTWRYRFRYNGKQTTVRLGEYPALSLDDARKAHVEARKSVKAGKHPEHARQADRQNTFEAVAQEWLAERLKIRTPRYQVQVSHALATHLFPVLGVRPIRSIEPPEVLALLREAQRTRGPTAALALRQWTGGVFRYGVAVGKCDRDVCADLRGALPEHRVTHHRTIEARDLPAFVAALEADARDRPDARLFLWLLLLLFPRRAELLEARFSEIDWPAALWRIPAARTKGRREHLVPLSTQAMARLREVQTLADGSEYLFPRRPRTVRARTPVMDARVAFDVLQRMGWLDRLTLHGLRALASTTLNEMGWRPDWIEMQLAHADRNVTRASYNHAAYLQERRRMMQAWSDFVTSRNVVPLRAQA